MTISKTLLFGIVALFSQPAFYRIDAIGADGPEQEVRDLVVSVLFANAGFRQHWRIEREIVNPYSEDYRRDEDLGFQGEKTKLMAEMDIAIEDSLRWRVWQKMDTLGEPDAENHQVEHTHIARGGGWVAKVHHNWSHIGERFFDLVQFRYTPLEEFSDLFAWHPAGWLLQNLQFLDFGSDFNVNSAEWDLDYAGSGKLRVTFSDDQQQIVKMTSTVPIGDGGGESQLEWVFTPERIEMRAMTNGNVHDRIVATIESSDSLKTANILFDYQFDGEPRFVLGQIVVKAGQKDLDQRELAGKWISEIRVPSITPE